MPSNAHDYVSLLTRVEVTLADALAAAEKITDRGALEYADAAAVTALDDIAGFAKKYAHSAEVRVPSTLLGMPILSDAGTQRALSAVVMRLNASTKLMGGGAQRIANTLERLARDKNPRDAALAGTQATTVARGLRLESHRSRPKSRSG